MNNELKALLKQILNEEIIVLSWGITNIHILDSSLRFNVSGMKYDGAVSISTDTNGYKINMETKYLNANLDDIIRILDDEIEKTDNYISDLSKLIH